MIKIVKYLDIDDDVNVYVVGDIHGAYSLLRDKLKEIKFDYNKDLLIAVGDLVDRGNENEKCIGLLNEHWFISIKGNHEDFCYKGMMDDHVKFYHRMHNNGGEWFYNLPEDLMEQVGRRLNQLPILLEVKYKGKKFGFVHGDVPVEDWELLKEMLINNDSVSDRTIEDYCLWSRGIIDKYLNCGYEPNIAQVDNVFLGHTVLDKVTQVGNCTFLDTGGVFKKFDNGYDLSIVNLSDYV